MAAYGSVRCSKAIAFEVMVFGTGAAKFGSFGAKMLGVAGVGNFDFLWESRRLGLCQT